MTARNAERESEGGNETDREAEPERARGGRFVADVGGVLIVWMVLLAIENVLVGGAYRGEFVGSWEMAHARYYLSPIAAAAALPLAVIAVAIARLVSARKAVVVGGIVCALGAGLAIGVSSGRHMTSLAVRVPFVVAVAIVAGTCAWLAARRLPMDRPRTVAIVGGGVAALAWLADALVLPRLYPAFHAALLVITLGAWAATFLIVRERPRWRSYGFVAVAAAVVAGVCMPMAARALVGNDNLRRVLVERAPLLGRAVLVASRIAPPPPIDEDAAALPSAPVARSAGGRALDWTGHDIIVVTIDALRADHVSSYGYPRATTPNIDRLAARGTRFEHAYCPTPHTSYSVTSMMTGKYMRPLVALDTGDDSETWASYLRRYGYRTAAFYPPAVFFIDEHRFRRMKTEGLGFEHRKEEFATPELRSAQIADYVSSAPKDKPLFLWVHLFEPHEPYVKHPEHAFGGDAAIDAYDSEIATADAVVGSIVDLVEARRPGAVFVVSADHGEEFGDHGGRYHGTTVYEEQVRVPLIVAGPGVAKAVVGTPVQTIDLLPTTLSALDVPQPARVRGRDLGATLAGKGSSADEGLAFAETDDYTLVARGNDRLICVRKIASCTLFDVAKDPLEKRAIGDRPARVQELRRLTAAIERENGKHEASRLPEALRRGLQGDRDAAEDVALLFDDARVEIRREAARCAFRLRAPVIAPQLQRTMAKDEDDEVRAFCAVALVRLKDAPIANGGAEVAKALASSLLVDPRPRLRLAAALALAEQGDGRGEGELVQRWEAAFASGAGATAREPGELDEARELLAALATIHARTATPVVARSLDDARLVRYVADALGEIGDPRAVPALLTAFSNERYIDARPREARALVRLGAREGLLEPLRRFAGVPEPMIESVQIARDAGLLTPPLGGWSDGARGGGSMHLDVEVTVAGAGPARLLVLRAGTRGALTARVNGAPVILEHRGTVATAELTAVGRRARVEVDDEPGVSALWIVRRADEIPPPAPRQWQPEPALGPSAADGGSGL